MQEGVEGKTLTAARCASNLSLPGSVAVGADGRIYGGTPTGIAELNLREGARWEFSRMLVKLSALVNEHAADLGTFITDDPKGRLIPTVLLNLAAGSLREREWFATEIAAMQKNIDHIKAIIAMQQDYASTAGVVEKLEAATLIEDALRMIEPNLSQQNFKVIRDFSVVPPLTVEKDKVLQVLINLIHNARDGATNHRTAVAKSSSASGSKQVLLDTFVWW